MDLGLAGKLVLVTGGSKGIGLATASAFAREGASVVLVARDAALLGKAADDLSRDTGQNIKPFAADLSMDEERERLFAAHPDIDILVNNAGAIPAGDIANVTMEAWRAGWDLKVFGYIHLCQLYVAAMKTRGSGTIVNIIGMEGGKLVRVTSQEPQAMRP